MILPDRLREAEEFLHEQIPLTRAMGVRVVPHGGNFAIEAPVALNHNHLQTAFGGSIHSVATLAGYALLWLELGKLPAHVVIRESSIRFLRPVRETLRAVCTPPDPQLLAAFRHTLMTNGKARLELRVQVEERGSIAAEFVATFVALMGR